MPRNRAQLIRDEPNDYRYGIKFARGVPRSYQPRRGGPPLLFATDARMTILIGLALSGGAMRLNRLWAFTQRKNIGCVASLVANGLVATWRLGRSETHVALDPAHPAAKALRKLLLKAGAIYGFDEPSYHVDNVRGGSAPFRPSRRRDVRYTFGDPNRTLSLLMRYILGEANAKEIERCVPRLAVKSVRHALWMFHAFGVLKSRRIVRGRSRGIGFRCNPGHVLAVEIARVLAALDAAMPQWRLMAERQIDASRRTVRQIRSGAKAGRWAW